MDVLLSWGRSDRGQHKDREEGMKWKDHEKQGELIELVMIG